MAYCPADVPLDIFDLVRSISCCACAKIDSHCKCDISGMNMPRDSMLGSNCSGRSVDVPFDIFYQNLLVAHA